MEQLDIPFQWVVVGFLLLLTLAAYVRSWIWEQFLGPEVSPVPDSSPPKRVTVAERAASSVFGVFWWLAWIVLMIKSLPLYAPLFEVLGAWGEIALYFIWLAGGYLSLRLVRWIAVKAAGPRTRDQSR